MRRLVAITALCLMPFGAPAQDASEEEDKGFLTNWLEENLSGGGREVTIEGFQGALSSEATIDKLTIADDEGIWITVEDAVLDWNRSALLRGNLQVTQLSAGSGRAVARGDRVRASGSAGLDPDRPDPRRKRDARRGDFG